MLNKKGDSSKVGLVILLIAVFLFVAIFITGYNPFNSETGVGRPESLGAVISNTQGFDTIFNNDRARVLDYIFGEVPKYLIDSTSKVSAGIIIIGLWLMLILLFGDALYMFGTFNPVTSWVSAAVLAIVAANLNVVKFIAALALIVTAGFGALSVFVALIGVFVLFTAFHFGSDWARKFFLQRRITMMKAKAAMGNEKAKEGLKTLQEIGEVAEGG